MSVTRTVLLVEDDAVVRDAMAACLLGAGYEVVAAATGEEAMSLLQDRPGEIDWLFTDVHLPGVIDGWRVADEFRFTHPLRPIIFVTGNTSESPRPIADSLFVRKPYRPSRIVKAFHELEANWSAYPDDLTAFQTVRHLPVWQAMSEAGQR